jgi:hypothetical protein
MLITILKAIQLLLLAYSISSDCVSTTECLAIRYYFTLAHKGDNFLKEIYWTWIVCFLVSIKSTWKFSHSKKKRMIYYQKSNWNALLRKIPTNLMYRSLIITAEWYVPNWWLFTKLFLTVTERNIELTIFLHIL